MNTPIPDPAGALRALVLASSSRYRRELLERLGVAFEVIAPAVDESPRAGETPRALAHRLALEKARAVAALRPDALVIGSDQTATADGVSVIGKPGGHAAAVRQLGEASGRALHYFTAVAVTSRASGFEQCRVVEARVQFRELDAATIEAYLAREPAYDCAGAAKVEGLGIALIAALECPDPTALVGLPLIELSELLALAGRPVL
ncbi:MAG TPA: Maf family nucleotide pyrophosphatase [Burkholderiaceae bacterium]